MLKWMRSSLPARAGFAVLLIAVLALASALSAGVIAWLSQDDAAAIANGGRERGIYLLLLVFWLLCGICFR